MPLNESTTITTPAWDEAPPGNRWLAQDMDGKWHWFSERPQPDTSAGRWIAPRGTLDFAGPGRRNRDWCSSLQYLDVRGSEPLPCGQRDVHV